MMAAKPKYIDELLSSVDYQKMCVGVPKCSSQHRHEDDSTDGFLSVVFSVDGDAWVKTTPPGEAFRRALRFRTVPGGGGQSPRVHKALRILALAIQADNEDKTLIQRD